MSSVILDALRHLQDEQHVVWRPIVASDQVWDEHLRVVSSTAKWMLIGQLHRRFVVAFKRWPWRLAEILMDDVPNETKRRIVDDFYNADECCMDKFSLWLRGHCADADAFLAEEHVHFLRHVLGRVPAENIGSENRFARAGRQQRASAGAAPAPSTVAAAHVITESKTILDTHLWSAGHLKPLIHLTIRLYDFI